VVGYAMPKGATAGGRVDGVGSKIEIERINSAANEGGGRSSEIVLRLFSGKSMAREKSSVRKRGGVVGENTPFNSLVLLNFSLHALLHVIPPPWGLYLSHPPNRKSHPREKSNQKSKMCATKDKARGGIGQVTGKKRKFLQNWSTPSSHPLFVSSWFDGTKVRLR